MEKPKTMQLISEAIATLKADKPGDRSERDRMTAIAITELEKILAYVAHNSLGESHG